MIGQSETSVAMSPSRSSASFGQLMDEVSKIMKNSLKLNFIEGGRPNPWEPRKYNLFNNPLLFSTGALYESIYSDSGEDFAEAGAKATVHQFGATFAVPITDRSRGYFWKMFYETHDEQWKYMALTKRSVFIVHISARMYVMFQEEDFVQIMETLGNGAFTLIAPGGSATITLEE